MGTKNANGRTRWFKGPNRPIDHTAHVPRIGRRERLVKVLDMLVRSSPLSVEEIAAAMKETGSNAVNVQEAIGILVARGHAERWGSAAVARGRRRYQATEAGRRKAEHVDAPVDRSALDKVLRRHVDPSDGDQWDHRVLAAMVGRPPTTIGEMSGLLESEDRSRTLRSFDRLMLHGLIERTIDEAGRTVFDGGLVHQATEKGIALALSDAFLKARGLKEALASTAPKDLPTLEDWADWRDANEAALAKWMPPSALKGEDLPNERLQSLLDIGIRTGELMADARTGRCKLRAFHYVSPAPIAKRRSADHAQKKVFHGITSAQLERGLGITRQGVRARMMRAMQDGYVRRIPGTTPIQYSPTTFDLNVQGVDPRWWTPIDSLGWPQEVVDHLERSGLMLLGDVARIDPLDFQHGQIPGTRSPDDMGILLSKTHVSPATHVPEEASMACLSELSASKQTPRPAVEKDADTILAGQTAQNMAWAVLRTLARGPMRSNELGAALGFPPPYTKILAGAMLLDRLGLIEPRPAGGPPNSRRTFTITASGRALAGSREFKRTRSIMDAVRSRDGLAAPATIPIKDRIRMAGQSLEDRLRMVGNILLAGPASAYSIEEALGRSHDASCALSFRILRHLVMRGLAERVVDADGAFVKDRGTLHALTEAGHEWLAGTLEAVPTRTQEEPTADLAETPGWAFEHEWAARGIDAKTAAEAGTMMRCRETGAYQHADEHFSSPLSIRRRRASDRVQGMMSGWHRTKDLMTIMRTSFERVRQKVSPLIQSGEVIRTHEFPMKMAPVSLAYARHASIPPAWLLPTDALDLPPLMTQELLSCALPHVGDVARLSSLDVLNHAGWGRNEVEILSAALAKVGLELDSPIPRHVSMRCLALNDCRPLPPAFDKTAADSIGAPLVEWMSRDDFISASVASGTSTHAASEWLGTAVRTGTVIKGGGTSTRYALAHGRREAYLGRDRFKERGPALHETFETMNPRERMAAIHDIVRDDEMTIRDLVTMIGIDYAERHMVWSAAREMTKSGALIARRPPGMGQPHLYRRGSLSALRDLAPEFMESDPALDLGGSDRSTEIGS